MSNKELILNLVGKNSNRRKESYIKKHYNNLHIQILEYTKNISDLPFKQLLWHFENEKLNYIFCACPNCNNRVNFSEPNSHYYKHCSPACSGNNPDTTEAKLFSTDRDKNTELTKQNFIKKHKQYFTENNLRFISINNTSNKYTFEDLSCNHVVYDMLQETIKRRIDNNLHVCNICNPYFLLNPSTSSKKSKPEQEIFDYINSDLKYIGVDSDHSVLDRKEIDIYLPIQKFAIEHNGVYWHSDIHVKFDEHQHKTIESNNKGISLLHIWGDEWLYKQEIVKSNILSYLNNQPYHKFAQSCLIYEVSETEKSFFLYNNHIDGTCGESLNLGLYYQGELVSILCLYTKNVNNNKIVRFANKLNTQVTDSFTKLFKYFIENYTYNKITIYHDLSKPNILPLIELRFIYTNRIEPQHKYVVNSKRLSYKELSISYISYNKIYDCGYDKYVFTKQNLL
jgi:hypothetical protein